MMTQEQRLDRLERIVKLMIKAGLRARREGERQDEKINMLINSQIKTDEQIAKLTESQAHSDRRLDALIDIVREGRNGKSQ